MQIVVVGPVSLTIHSLTSVGSLALVAQWLGTPCSFLWRSLWTCSSGPEFALCGNVQNEPTSSFRPHDSGPGRAVLPPGGCWQSHWLPCRAEEAQLQ